MGNHSHCFGCDDRRTVELLMYTQPLFRLMHRVGSCTQDLCRAEKEQVSSTSSARHGTAWVVVGDGTRGGFGEELYMRGHASCYAILS